MRSTLVRGCMLALLAMGAPACRAAIDVSMEPGAGDDAVPVHVSPAPTTASGQDDLAPMAEPAPRQVETAVPPSAPPPSFSPSRSPSPSPAPSATEVSSPSATAAPAWLGSRVLADGWSDIVLAQDTPPELQDRRLISPDGLPAPVDDQFRATVQPVPEDVAGRSTWRPECPVALDDLRYATVTFWGFDGRHHTGEFLANAAVADDLVAVFERLHAERFPIEEMRVIAAEELEGPRTGDGNVTTVFVCRQATQSQSWSQHAYGLAIDINPFHNPYLKGDVVRPEFATAYTDRDWVRSGMITRGDPVTEAFAAIGWTWGGEWNSLKDWMHFSLSGR